jgi:hypothetical protein
MFIAQASLSIVIFNRNMFIVQPLDKKTRKTQWNDKAQRQLTRTRVGVTTLGVMTLSKTTFSMTLKHKQAKCI